MFRRTAISLAALGAFTTLAFGSMSGGSSMGDFDLPTPSSGGGQGNVDACTAYVEHMNSLDCTGGLTYEVSDQCAGQENIMADTSPMWDCMVENFSCKDGILDAGDSASCGDKIVY